MTKTARKRLEVRGAPHFRRLRDGLSLGYRRLAGGVAGKWVVRKLGERDEHGKREYKESVIGTADDVEDSNGSTVLNYDQAVDKAGEVVDAALPSGDPLTVRVAVQRYVKHLEAHAKTAKDTEQRLGLHLLPKLGDRTVNSLTKTDISSWHAGLVRGDDAEAIRKSKDTANRLLSMCKAALNMAAQDPANGITSDAAWRLTKPFKSVGAARDVFLSPEECQRLVDACEGDFRNLVIAGILTGARYGELAEFDVRDFDPKERTLTVRDGKTGDRRIYLRADDLPFFKALAGDRDGREPLILRDGGRWHKSEQHRPMKAAAKAAKLDPATTLYSLRHSYASEALRTGMQMQLLAENLGTSIRMIEENYGKLLAQSRREMVEATAPRLLGSTA
ncbi:tyrosine-type recombinase/integrase [Inquilinus sp. OTU3971]|uniref:tyrosine-type recombinase/integrase n=1 Tax=Inquilinus sp. OTU3971 TaxID=3043855 RepID=UPI00313E1D7F